MNVNINAYNKRERREDDIPQDPYVSKRPSIADVLLARPVNIQQQNEVRAPTVKREREWIQLDENGAVLKKHNHNVLLEQRGNKRGREEDFTLYPAEEEVDDLPIIEEIPEPCSATIKTAQLVLALITCTPGELQRQKFRLACVRGEIEYIQEYIKTNPSVLADLCEGMPFRNSQMNDLLVGLTLAIVNNRSSVVNFLLNLRPVKQHVHFEKNLVLRVAFCHNRLCVSSKLLQIPAVLNTIDMPFIERYLVSAAESGNIFQFLMVLSMPRTEKALHLLGCSPTCNSFLDVVTHVAAKFPQFQSAWKDFLDTDYILVKEDGQTFLVHRDELLEILKKTHLTTGHTDDLPDLTKLTLN